MNILIRKVEAKDSEAIQEVFYKAWLNAYPNKEIGITKEDIEKKFKDNFTQSFIDSFAEKIRNLLPSVLFLVAVDKEENERVVGLCRVFLKDNYNELQAIYILPEYQNKGIGGMLWDKVVGSFSVEKDTIVHVATYNKSAISFYEKLGFVDSGKRFTEERHKMPISGVVIPEMELVIKKQPEHCSGC